MESWVSVFGKGASAEQYNHEILRRRFGLVSGKDRDS